MFNSDINSFGDDSVSDLLIDDDSHSPGVDIEDSASSAMIVFVGHALVDGTVDSDVDDVSDFEGGQLVGNMDGSVSPESLCELVSGSPLVSI